MNTLVLNRFKYTIINDSITIYIRCDEKLFFRKEANFVIKKFREAGYTDLVKEIENKLPHDYMQNKVKISFDFHAAFENGNANAEIELSKVPYFKKHFIKRFLLDLFKLDGFIIEPFVTGADLSIFKKNQEYNVNWDTYTSYGIVIHSWENEISVGINSSDTLISKTEQTITDSKEYINAIDPSDGYIKRLNKIEKKSSLRIIANKSKRIEIGVKNKIKKQFYNENFKLINEMYNFLLNNAITPVRIESGGFKTVHPSAINQVNSETNLMLFGRGHTDINAATGMREGGPFELPKKRVEQIKFLFIYQNKEQANSLYFSLKKGLRHYPGLLSYVGIPVNIANERLQYKSNDSLRADFDNFLYRDLPNTEYPDYFALVLIPFNKESASTEDSKTYYYIKEKLLQKQIPSQDIQSSKINSEYFHFHLPNISIAILAKIGGIPWKLKIKPYQELVIGFNEQIMRNGSILGNAIYFDNSGKIQQVKAFPIIKRRDEMIHNLRDSIQQYLDQHENNPPKRLIIHYYKPPRNEEMKDIDKLIRDEFRFNMPFALIEINDSIIKNDLCFDVEYNYGMPTSGSFIRLQKDEYLLFNNLRYWANPIKTISNEEYPIKVKLYNTESGGFTHNELLSQIYEFSRLYWKGLKQCSQPVTTRYSKMIAEFASNFENFEIPQNSLSQNTVWFI